MTTTEIRIYVGKTGTHAFDGFKGLRIGQRYTNLPQEDGRMLTAPIGAPAGTGVEVSSSEWHDWFEKASAQVPAVDDNRFDF